MSPCDQDASGAIVCDGGVQDVVSDQQVLRREGPDEDGPGAKDHPGDMQGRTGRPQGGRGPGAEVHIIPVRVQWALRGPGGHLTG